MTLLCDAEPTAAFSVLVLAGRRGGKDPVAQAAGVPLKALALASGVPLLVRVVRSLRAMPGVNRVLVSCENPELVLGLPELAALREEGFLETCPSASSPAASVHAVLSRLREPGALLVTTADHPLLTPKILTYFCVEADQRQTDIVVGVVTEDVVRARFPETRRTWIPLRGERLCGANLFWFRGERAARAALFWMRAERYRKQPWRLARVFGISSLLSFWLRRLDLNAALSRVSCAMGVRVEAVRLPFAECAVDVDRPEDLALVNRLLAEEETERGAGL